MAPLQPTADMPLVNPMMQFLVAALEDLTLVDLTLARTTLALDLGRLRHVKPKATIQLLTEDLDASVTIMMLRMNKGVISSLVRHTLAYDFLPRPANSGHPAPPKTFNPRHRGTYATSIAIKGRDGKFLTKLEIYSLVARLRAYVDAADYLSGINIWPNAAIRDAHKRVIENIDRRYRSGFAPSSKPRFIPSTRAGINTRLLISSLERYASFPGPGNVPLRQSPIMVGCTSKTIEEITRCPLPGSGLHSTTATWGLTLCAIEDMGLVPEVVVVPILVTQTNDELPLAERLVTTLAQSFVEQDGFNIIEAGGQGDKSGPAATQACMTHVYVGAPWVNVQLETALNEMERRSKVAAFCTTLQAQPGILGGLTARAILARPKFNSLVRAACTFFNMEHKEREFLEAFTDEVRTVQDVREEDDALYSLLGAWTRVAEDFDIDGN